MISQVLPSLNIFINLITDLEIAKAVYRVHFRYVELLMKRKPNCACDEC